MQAMILRRVVSLDSCDQPLELTNIPEPSPRGGELLVRVSVCGVCHTELDEIEGRVTPPSFPIVPGHQVIGRIEQLGQGVTAFRLGDRVGIGWIHSSSGDARENLSPEFRATGLDANGGYAELMTVPANYAYPIPDFYTDLEAAPLMCAGAVGYRSLKLTHLTDGQRLGFTGFGGSAHIVLQLARRQFPSSPIFVFARDPSARELARSLGADWAGGTMDWPPQPLDAIIDTTPAWTPVVAALERLAPGGRLVINAIRKEDSDKDALSQLNYHEHLWMEREIKSVANVTQFDIREFLPLAAEAQIKTQVKSYPLADANRAIMELKWEPVCGAKVLVVGPDANGYPRI